MSFDANTVTATAQFDITKLKVRICKATGITRLPQNGRKMNTTSLNSSLKTKSEIF